MRRRRSGRELCVRRGRPFAIARDLFVRAENVGGGIVAVHVRRDEIYRDILFYGVLDEAIGPGGLRGGGSADAQVRVDLLYGSGGGVVESWK